MSEIEADVLEAQDLVVQTAEAVMVGEPRSPQEMVRNIIETAQIAETVKRSLMRDGTHFGVIPGTKNPTLYKAGAEKLLMAFGLSHDVKIQNLSTPDVVEYMAEVTIYNAEGRQLGKAYGKASSEETKWKWRKAKGKEYENTPSYDRREYDFYDKYKSQWVTAKQVRQELADVSNTVLQMATKRALVPATRTTLGLSDIFSEGVEDLPEHLVNQDLAEMMPGRKPGKPKQGQGSHAKSNNKPPQRVQEPQRKSQSDSSSRGGGEPEMFTDKEQWREAMQTRDRNSPISQKQASRLFGIANSNGWEFDDVRSEVDFHLGCPVEEIHWGPCYEAVCEIFSQQKMS